MPALLARAVEPVPIPRREPDADGDPAATVAAARAGDRDALARLHAEYAPVVHGILLARLPSADCDDLVQDVFINVIRRLPSLRDDRAFPAWVATMARNFAASFFRSRARAGRNQAVVARIGPRGSEPPAPDRPAQANPAVEAIERLQAQEILALIAALPQAYSETLMLRLVEGLTGPQIAARTGMSHGAVRVNLHRGMAMLRERLAAVGPAAQATGEAS